MGGGQDPISPLGYIPGGCTSTSVKKKSGCTCPLDSVKEILTSLNHGASVAITQQQHFCLGPPLVRQTSN